VEVSRQLRQAQQEASGGRASLGFRSSRLRTLATVKTAAGNCTGSTLALASGRHIRLDQIAQISDTIAERRASGASLDGQPVVAFEVVRSRGESEVAVGSAVRAALEQLQPAATRHRTDPLAFDFVTPG
jgi:multidrug efflux pump subunit AcrB